MPDKNPHRLLPLVYVAVFLLLVLIGWRVKTTLWNPETRVGFLIGEALQHAESYNFDRCEASVRDALELLPDNPRANLVLGKSLLMQQKYEEAEPVLRRAHELNVQQAPLYGLVDLGVCLDRWSTVLEEQEADPERVAAMREEARSLLSKVAYGSNDDQVRGLALFNFGAFLKERGEYGEAAGIYEKCYQILEELRDRREEAFQNFEGSFDFETRMLLKEGLKGSREQAAQCWFILADMENSTEYYEKSLHWYLLCHEANPDHVDSLLGIARCEIALENYTEAIYHLERTVSLNPQFSFGWYWLAVAHHFLENDDSALEALKNGRGHTTDDSLLARMDALESEISEH